MYDNLLLLLSTTLKNATVLLDLSDSMYDAIITSLLQLILYLLQTPVFQSTSQILLNQFISLIVTCYKQNSAKTTQPHRILKQRLQQILVMFLSFVLLMDRVCNHPRITDTVEVIIELGNDLGKQETDYIASELLAGMMKRIRKHILPNLLQGDYIRCMHFIF